MEETDICKSCEALADAIERQRIQIGVLSLSLGKLQRQLKELGEQNTALEHRVNAIDTALGFLGE